MAPVSLLASLTRCLNPAVILCTLHSDRFFVRFIISLNNVRRLCWIGMRRRHSRGHVVRTARHFRLHFAKGIRFSHILFQRTRCVSERALICPLSHTSIQSPHPPSSKPLHGHKFSEKYKLQVNLTRLRSIQTPSSVIKLIV